MDQRDKLENIKKGLKDKATAANSGLAKKRVQWLI